MRFGADEADITAAVFPTLMQSEAFIAFATATYAEDTGNPACTYQELQYWRTTMAKTFPDKLIPICMLRDGESFDVSRKGVFAAKVLFGTNLAYELWPLGSSRRVDWRGNVLGTTVPEKLVKKVLQVVKPPTSGQELSTGVRGDGLQPAPPPTSAKSSTGRGASWLLAPAVLLAGMLVAASMVSSRKRV